MHIILTSVIFLFLASAIKAQWYFPSSIHKTRLGFNTAYSIQNGGMETITNIPYDQLKCKKCHSLTGLFANGTLIDPENYSPICVDCHNFQNGFVVLENDCLNCHQKQKREKELYPGLDVHANAGLTCISCHSKEELHGDDNIVYSSLKEPGAVKAKCTNCHTQLSNNGSHNHHLGKVDCSACHSVSVYSCGGCHFESYTAADLKRINNEFKDYRLLIKKDGMVKLGSIVTHSYHGKTNYVISYTHSHIIKRNASTCSDCHRGMGQTNIAIQEYNNTGYITLLKWNDAMNKVENLRGVIPVPADWKSSLKIDHVTYTGDSLSINTDPNLWVYLKSETDNAHMYFADPLDSSTLDKLGFTRFPTNVESEKDLPTEFILFQNYPNPFNPSTIISYQLPVSGNVTLKVFDVLGREVALLVEEYKNAGSYKVEFNPASSFKNLPAGRQATVSGIYFYQLKAGDFIATNKMLLIK